MPTSSGERENRSIDEKIVNTALLSFRQALIVKSPDISSEWTGHRIALKEGQCRFGDPLERLETHVEKGWAIAASA